MCKLFLLFIKTIKCATTNLSTPIIIFQTKLQSEKTHNGEKTFFDSSDQGVLPPSKDEGRKMLMDELTKLEERMNAEKEKELDLLRDEIDAKKDIINVSFVSIIFVSIMIAALFSILRKSSEFVL